MLTMRFRQQPSASWLPHAQPIGSQRGVVITKDNIFGAVAGLVPSANRMTIVSSLAPCAWFV